MKLPFSIDLNGKTAVVTGGTGVLCAAFCQALAACGAKVAILARKAESAQPLLAAIQEAGQGEAAFFAADVTDQAALQQARQDILARFGPPDILINGAGGNNPAGTTEDEFYQLGADVKDFFKLDMEGLKFVFDLNYHGTLMATQIFAQDMVGRPGACIINISSMAASRAITKVAAYSSAKAAIDNLTRWLATYFAPAGLRVNAIAPGFFATQQNHSLLFQADGQPTPRTGKILRGTPMGRFGLAEELIGTLLYLVSPEASGFVTGAVIPVDGGFDAYSGV